MINSILKFKIIFILPFIYNLVFSSLKIEGDSLPAINAKIKTIAIFKNGLGFFIREGKAFPQNGWAVINNVPNAALGSMWMSLANKSSYIEEAIAFREDINNIHDADSYEELLKANIGKRIQITYNDKIIEGNIKSVPVHEQEPTKVAIIETKDGLTALNISFISKLEFLKDFSPKIPIKEKVKRIRVKIAGHAKETDFNLSYLQKGICWVPSYLINIKDPGKASITMQAILINDIEDFENIDAFFVVGYPSFIFSDKVSPMTLDESLSQFLSMLNRQGRGYDQYGAFPNVAIQAPSAYNEESRISEYSTIEVPEISGTAEEDLFFYNKKGISLKKGERAYYPIFSGEIDYKHLYEWDIPNTMFADPNNKESVWHSVKLTNSTNYPWTTAPAFVLNDRNPIAQNVLNYTPKGSKVDLKLTIASDIKTDRKESEVERERNIKFYSRYYDLVTVKGELLIKNFKDKGVTMEITKNLVGEVIEASHSGKIKKLAEGLKGTNFNSVISWEIPIKAGEEINIVYKYKTYQPN